MTILIDPTLSQSSGVTLDDIVARVRRRLTDRDNINKLSAQLDSSAETLTLKYRPSTLARGTLLCINDEVVQVWETSGNTITIERGCDETDPAYHDPNSLVYVGGKSRAQIVDAINDELMSLSAKDIYQMKSVQIANYSAGQWAYEIDQLDRSSIYDVQWSVPGQTVDWRHLSGWTFSAIDNAIVFDYQPWFSTGVRVVYKTGFNKFTDGGEDVQSDAGLQAEAADVLIWGALYRLTIGDEYIRDDFRTQGDTRRPDEVPPGAVLRSTIAGFKTIHDERLGEEQDRLRRRFPTRKLGW